MNAEDYEDQMRSLEMRGIEQPHLAAGLEAATLTAHERFFEEIRYSCLRLQRILNGRPEDELEDVERRAYAVALARHRYVMQQMFGVIEDHLNEVAT